MNPIPQDELKTLLHERGTCVSLYIPTHRRSPESQQDPIRFKNLLRDAERRLRERGMRQPDIDSLLGPARDLLNDGPFWMHQADGLVCFLTPEFARTYRLPRRFEEMVVVNDRFYLKPLLPLLHGTGRFLVLAISQNKVRLFDGTPYSVEEVPLENMPTSLAEALQFDDPEEQLQLHTAMRMGFGTGDRSAVYHGQGVGKDDAAMKVNVERYFRKVDKGLNEHLRNRRDPLVFAGVEHLFPIFKTANNYANLVEKPIGGNPDEERPEDLHAEAWKLVEPLFRKQFERDADRYRQFANSGGNGNAASAADAGKAAHAANAADAENEAVAGSAPVAGNEADRANAPNPGNAASTGKNAGKATMDLRQILQAAREGRIETLFVAVDTHRWGQYDGGTHVVLHGERQPGDEDLLDRAALETMFTGGRIHPVPEVEMPDESPAAAILRF